MTINRYTIAKAYGNYKGNDRKYIQRNKHQ